MSYISWREFINGLYKYIKFDWYACAFRGTVLFIRHDVFIYFEVMSKSACAQLKINREAQRRREEGRRFIRLSNLRVT